MFDLLMGLFMGLLLGASCSLAVLDGEFKKAKTENAERDANCAMWQYELNVASHDPNGQKFRDLVNIRPEGCAPSGGLAK